MNTTKTETNKAQSDHASCAKAIRADLKAAFPGIKFSVRSESYSGGDSVRISWVDGPAYEAVDSIGQKYRAGNFDGMTDCYNYRKDAPAVSVSYVFSNREISNAVSVAAVAQLRAEFVPSTPALDIETRVYRILRNADLTKGFGGFRYSAEAYESFEVLPAEHKAA